MPLSTRMRVRAYVRMCVRTCVCACGSRRVYAHACIRRRRRRRRAYVFDRTSRFILSQLLAMYRHRKVGLVLLRMSSKWLSN